MIVLTEAEERIILAERRRRQELDERLKREHEARVVRRDGPYSVIKEQDRKHTPWGVYDGEELVCLCVYRKGAFALVDYIKRRLAPSAKEVA